MRIAALFAPALVTSLAACGGGGSSGADAQIILNDAAPDARPCGASPQYGSPTAMNEIATRDADTMPEEIYYESALNADPQYDAITLQLYKGFGAFETGEIEPKLIPLNVTESQYETCGACVILYADYDDATGATLGGTYLASGGSLNLAGVSPNIRGMLLNTRLVEVMIDEDTGVSTPTGNCAAELMSFQFDFPVTTEAPAFTGANKPRKPVLRTLPRR